MEAPVGGPWPSTRSAFFRALNDDLMRLSRPAATGVRLIVCECSRPECAESLEVCNGGDNGRSAVVLIVDDDPALRVVCSLNLQLEGLGVLEAADGDRGVELARRDLPDLVVTGVRMPRLDGFGLGEALRGDERTRRIPLIDISGESDVAGATRAHELGALAYVSKPFDAPLLASVASGVIARLGAPTQTATKG